MAVLMQFAVQRTILFVCITLALVVHLRAAVPFGCPDHKPRI